MCYNFDLEITRKGTRCTKWDNLAMRVSNPDALPMWVADCDFACPAPVTQAVQKRAAHPIYGYAFVPPEFGAVTAGWLRRQQFFLCTGKYSVLPWCCPGAFSGGADVHSARG